ncbi:MAG: internal scaffolding protein [Microvirus sp.]|nr:MAG: internal scaffolding protein [Microvirus sp.]
MAKNRFTWRVQGDIEQDRIAHEACITYFHGEESLTQQHFTEAADLNTIAKRFGLEKGPLPIAPLDPNAYGDFSNVPDLRTILDLAHQAKESFNELPPKLRARFNNEPAQLWEFVNDPENADEAVRLGLLKRRETPPEPPTADKLPIDNKLSPST